jgi:maltooligosyltrehalose trehalohydrolase
MTNRFKARTHFGANMDPSGVTRFTLWAPDTDHVMLEVEGSEPVPMRKEKGGHFAIEFTCGAGARYRFRVRSDLAVPDPASRAQAGDVHDASLVVDPAAYQWRHPEWMGRPWHEAIIYELHVGAIGGFAAVTQMLPNLAALGITAVELMPINDFPGHRNWGYDGVLPYAPDASYGTPDQLKHLIDTAHGLGLMVLLDVVYNHFGPDGNYLHVYSGDFFRKDIMTPWGAAIDFRRPEVRTFFIDNALLWLQEYRFDGLRFDAVHAFHDRDFLADIGRSVRSAIEPGRHVHLVLENDDNDAEALRQAFDAQWSDDGHHALHILLTGERAGYYADYPDPAASLARVLQEGFAYQGEASRHRGGEQRGSVSSDLPPTAFVLFLQNHDQIGNRAFGERLTTLANPAALAAATLLLLLSPQIPLLFMGEEWGETKPFLFFTDHHGELADQVKEGRRREFAHFAEFADSATRERIPDPNNPETFRSSTPTSASRQTQVHQLTRDFYARLIALRSTHVTPHLPGTKPIQAETLGANGVRAVWRLGNGAELTIAVNFGADPVPCAEGKGRCLAAVPDATVLHGQLPGCSAIVWLSEPEGNS